MTEATGFHLTVVRRHMEQLVAAGLVQTRSERTGRGRPRLLYSPTREGRETLYAKYDLVLETITRVLSAKSSEDGGREAFAEGARLLARDAGGPKSINATLPLLEDLGFQPELRSENGTKILVSRNCPVLQVAERYPELICDVFHTVLAGSLVGATKVEIGPTISRGAPECIHRVHMPHPPLKRRATGPAD
ncbi:MAG TPA: hypothetical protein VGX00_01965 [Thermoplasmata archaeon]|nr:hypothetical protein [Thermoplasmata archaeon]